MDGDHVGPGVILPAEEVPPDHKHRQSSGHQGGVVHRTGSHGHVEGETEDDNEDNNVQAADRVHHIANPAFHEEGAWGDALAASQEMRQDGCQIREGGQLYVASHEGVKSGGRTDIDDTKYRDYDNADTSGIEWVVVHRVHLAEEAGERGSVVAGESPEDSTSGDVAAYTGDKCRKEGDNEQP